MMKKQNEMLNKLKEYFDNYKGRSAWDRGVNEYVLELLESLHENYHFTHYEVNNAVELHKCLLNGAPSWEEYSWGGCSLIYDEDVAERLCTPSQLKRYDGGRLDPNKQERWLDIQKSALLQASKRILHAWEF